jgi:hypothetical protein
VSSPATRELALTADDVGGGMGSALAPNKGKEK